MCMCMHMCIRMGGPFYHLHERRVDNVHVEPARDPRPNLLRTSRTGRTGRTGRRGRDWRRNWRRNSLRPRRAP